MERLVFILQTALGIGLLIFVHELGHYLAARLAGVRVEVFSLGFGPRIWGFRRGPTDYRVSIVPVGGYVRVAGEDQHAPPGHATPADGLHSKGFGARALFFSGGVLMNLLFAMVAFPLIFHGGVEFNAPVIGAVEPGGTAWRAGLRTGDRILELDGKPMYSFENLLVGEAQIEVDEGAELTHLGDLEGVAGHQRRLRVGGLQPVDDDLIKIVTSKMGITVG